MDMENDGVFYTLYIHQTLASILLGQIAAAANTFIFSSLLYLNYQLKLLGYRFSQCGHDIRMSDDAKYEQFIDCIKMHLEIIE